MPTPTSKGPETRPLMPPVDGPEDRAVTASKVLTLEQQRLLDEYLERQRVTNALLEIFLSRLAQTPSTSEGSGTEEGT